MTVEYLPNALIIKVPTSDPVSLHAHLLRSITANLKYCMATPNKPQNFGDDLGPLVRLLEAMMPGEKELLKVSE